jgi:capsular polysaccharide transport system permease protein
MTVTALQKLEKRLDSFRNSLQIGQWQDAAFLLNKASELSDKDLALSRRLLQRVKNLKPNDVKLVERIAEVSKELKLTQPEVMSTSSLENKPVIKAVIQESSKREGNKFNFTQIEYWKLQLKKPFVLVIVLPLFLYAFYQIIWASPRYQSQTQLIIKQPDGMSTLDPSMAILSGFSGGSGGADTELVRAFISSNDMLTHLEGKLQITEHFSNPDYDYFSRLSGSASNEDKLKYFKKRVLVEIDEKSSVLTIMVQAYEPNIAQALSQEIASRAEWFINEIGHNLAKAQLGFVQNEHDLVEQKLQKAKSQLLSFQRDHRLLDPEAEGLALQQITYGLEGQIATQKAELRALRSSMSESAPLVMQAKDKLNSMNVQLQNERQRLTQRSHSESLLIDANADLGVNEILARYSDHKINLEFALQAYTSSQISLEKSRIEAYRQLKYLVVVERPTLPEDARYPRIIYNLSLFIVVLLMMFGIGKIIIATAEELR